MSNNQTWVQSGWSDIINDQGIEDKWACVMGWVGGGPGLNFWSLGGVCLNLSLSSSCCMSYSMILFFLCKILIFNISSKKLALRRKGKSGHLPPTFVCASWVEVEERSVGGGRVVTGLQRKTLQWMEDEWCLAPMGWEMSRYFCPN